ncbi:GL26378 [Drosophila persimilis]|uniref:GL26378 n=1 Tax=Drosophila persimilis TaxID=7234 RepID=B4GT14_DROPE|nr:GL26378 [Drosophila persimilis]
MVLMTTYFFCASVRLGILVICFFAMCKSIIIMYVIFDNGTAFMFSVIRIFENDVNYRTSFIVKESINWVEKYPREIMMVTQLYSFCHILSCILGAFGAYRLKKYHVMPLCIFEFLYTVQIVGISVISLRIARHVVPLGTLILLTLTLTFYAMLVAYDNLALIAFIQIMVLVNSEKYQRLYGTDPLNPILYREEIPQKSRVENPLQQPPIIIYVMPKVGQKLWHLQPQKWWQDMEGLIGYFLKLLFQSIQTDFEQGSSSTRPNPGYVRQHGDYWVWHNYILAGENLVANESVTLATHATYVDLQLLPTLLIRWKAPISLTIYANGDDLDKTIKGLAYINTCLHLSVLMRRFVSIHLVWHQDHMPLNFRRGSMGVTAEPLMCNKPPIYLNATQELTYWHRKKLQYPMNLMRNVARLNVLTYYVLSMDIQLLPTYDFPEKFLKFILIHDVWRYADISQPYTTVFCLLTFPHVLEAPLAQNKFQLIMILRDFNIISPVYDNIDVQMKWLSTQTAGEELYIFSRSKKMDACVAYVSINELEPLYDEGNKMESIYEHGANLKGQVMIDLDYTFIILDGAFLIRRTFDSWQNLKPKDHISVSQTRFSRMWHIWHLFYSRVINLVPKDFAQVWYTRSRTSRYFRIFKYRMD